MEGLIACSPGRIHSQTWRLRNQGLSPNFRARVCRTSAVEPCLACKIAMVVASGRLELKKPGVNGSEQDP